MASAEESRLEVAKAKRLLERRSMIRVLDTPQGEEAEELWVSGADIRASLEVRPAP